MMRDTEAAPPTRELQALPNATEEAESGRNQLWQELEDKGSAAVMNASLTRFDPRRKREGTAGLQGVNRHVSIEVSLRV